MTTTRPRHVLITGGSRGIGLAIAQLFASKSYRCTLLSRNEQALKSALSSLPPLPAPPSPSSPYAHAYIASSVSAPSFWTHGAAPSSFSAHLPRPASTEPNHASHIDVLVNCAGVTQGKLFVGLPTDELLDIVNTNLTATMLGTKFLLRSGYMRGERGKGHGGQAFAPVVINVASLLGVKGGHGAVAYAAAKAGVLGFTRALASEYQGVRVRVNALVPGYIDTDMTRDLKNTELERRIPLGRFGTVDEVAHAALFLAENQYAHNCVLNLDGGLSAV